MGGGTEVGQGVWERGNILYFLKLQNRVQLINISILDGYWYDFERDFSIGILQVIFPVGVMGLMCS